MLQIKNLTKRYGDKLAVDNLSLHIMPGEIYGFIGHNGAGKTTTIKACTGILNFEEGDILIDGVSIKEKPLECKKQMAYIPDNPEPIQAALQQDYDRQMQKLDEDAARRKYADFIENTG